MDCTGGNKNIKQEPLDIKEEHEKIFERFQVDETGSDAIPFEFVSYGLANTSDDIKIKKEDLSIQDECDNYNEPLDTIVVYNKRKLNSVKEKPHECNICFKRFTQKCNLTSHSRIHTGEKPFVCDICHKGFYFTSHLKRHKQRHSVDKSYMCDICDIRFPRKSILMAHMYAHTGEKPHECDICHKRFTRKSHVTVHMRIHRGEKPFACDICHKGFCYTSHLNRHKLIHSGEKSLGT